MKQNPLLLSLLFLLLPVPLLAQEVPLAAAQQKITAVSSVRVRSGPQVSSQEITRLRLGTVVTAIARSSGQSEIGGKNDYWYRISLSGEEPGWIFGGLLQDYDSAHRSEIIGRIIDERLSADAMSFDDGVDFYNFVTGELEEATGEDRGRLELMRLHALERAVGPIPIGEQGRPPYREFHKTHAAEIYHHEFAGSWAVRPEVFWKLEEKYRGSAIGDRIAWDAANALRQGECESDEVCNFLDLCQTQGRYLGLYPEGEHAGEALQNILQSLSSEDVSGTLASKGGDKYLADERKELKKAIAALRPVVARTSAPEKKEILSKIDALGGGR
jgi:hypothetical protein